MIQTPGLCTLLLTALFFGAGFTQTGLAGADTWAYQLQNIDIQAITENPSFNLIVMDYSADGSDELKFMPEEIASIKNSGKIPIAYISIGEAEDYRFYWQAQWLDNPPEWLGSENPDWPGNYKVKYWYPEWQNIIFSYIDTIYAQGFDGIYMDLIDAYWYWSDENGSEPSAPVYMIQFVENIREHIDQTGTGQFYLIPQNGEYIISETIVTDQMAQAYLTVIDAIGVEDVFFYGDLDEDNPYNPDIERLDLLDSGYLSNGIPVYSVEYLTDTDLIQQYSTEAVQHGFIPYISTRPLDTLFDGMDLYQSLTGDVNFDGFLDVLDVVVIINYIIENIIPDDTVFLAADIVADGVLDVLDIVALVALILN